MLKRWRRPIIVALVAAVVGGLLAIFRIIDGPHVIAIAATLVGADYLVSQGRSRAPEPWPAVPLRFRGGARTEVARLAWTTIDRQGYVSATVLDRVRAVAIPLLAQHGVQWSGLAGSPMMPAARARELLGPPAVNTLTTKAKVRPRALENAVARLERVAATAPLADSPILAVGHSQG